MPKRTIERPAPAPRTARPLNAELQVRTDAVGTWVMLMDGEVGIPLTHFGPDRADLRDRVVDLINPGASTGLEDIA